MKMLYIIVAEGATKPQAVEYRASKIRPYNLSSKVIFNVNLRLVSEINFFRPLTFCSLLNFNDAIKLLIEVNLQVS